MPDGLPTIVSLNVGRPAWHMSGTAAHGETKWYSGIVKSSITEPVLLGELNLEGDEQADGLNHGGRDKAVLAYAWSHYNHWPSELGRTTLPVAAFGENFTLSNCNEATFCIGDTYEVGAAILQVSQPRQPCWKQERRLDCPGLIVRMTGSGRTGWYFRVLRAGLVGPGNQFRLVARPNPDWTVEAANRVMYARPIEVARDHSLAACPYLSESWVNTLLRRSPK